ncbi:MAG: hypothetical protein LBK68_03720, partial [Candidatus Margulisbacteria bacterium]|nr:hypothetical protein [Candidatus Margulisiibacteriota bacterium]
MTIATGERMYASDILNLIFFPKGAILIFSSAAWNATSEEFKNIWKICNATNHTADKFIPDLTNKFLCGADSSGSIGGGTAELTTANLPSHGHELSGLTISSNDGGHAHTNNITATIATDSGTHAHDAGSLACPVEGGTHGHELSITSVTGGTHEHSVSGSTNSTNDAAGTAAKSLTGYF